MLNQIRSEWVKIRSVRSTIVMFILAISLTAIVAGLSQIQAKQDGTLSEIFTGIAISTIFFMVLGVQYIGQEYRFKTIRSTFAITPDRLKVMLAKIIVLVITIFVAVTFLIMISILVAQITLSVQGKGIDFNAPGTSRFFFGGYIYSILTALFGFGIGSILRQPIAGIIVGLIWMFVVENVINAIGLGLEINIGKWLPFIELNNSMNAEGLDPHLMSATGGRLYAAMIFSIILIFGVFLIKRRDA